MSTVSGGVVFRVGAELHFLPASVALEVMPMPDVARVPGAPPEIVGVALVGGETVPVVALSEAGRPLRARGAMLVVVFLGERIGLVGLDVLATGRFETDLARAEGGVVVGDRVASPFDVGALVARVRDARWAV